MMESKLKVDVLSQNVLGYQVYEQVKKYIPAWRADYESIPPDRIERPGKYAVVMISWPDYLTHRVELLNKQKQYNVYEGDKRIGTTQANSPEDAVEKFKPFFKGQLIAKRIGTLKV